MGTERKKVGTRVGTEVRTSGNKVGTRVEIEAG